MVSLNREVHDPEPISFPRSSDRMEHHAKTLARPQPRRFVAHARRDVHRIPRLQLWSPRMRHSSTGLLRPACARPISTPPAITELKPELSLFASH
jgi:hypothetical protein